MGAYYWWDDAVNGARGAAQRDRIRHRVRREWYPLHGWVWCVSQVPA